MRVPSCDIASEYQVPTGALDWVHDAPEFVETMIPELFPAAMSTVPLLEEATVL